jgi:ketosteroid isomerase-like protein
VLWATIFCGIGVGGLPAAADTTAAGDTKSQIVAALAAFTAALTRGDSVEQVTNLLYAKNVLIVEPGEPPVRGIPATLKAMHAWEDSLGPGGVKDCNYKVIDPVIATARTFSSFLYMTCRTNGVTTKKDMELQLLYVWEKRPEGWRVVLESVNEGGF